MISWWVRGQFSLPFRTTVLPQASGVAIARTPRMMGAFHGAMPSTTPAGWRMPMASEPGTSEGITSPADLRGQRRRLADHAGGQHHVEAGPHAGGAGLGRNGFDELRHLGFQFVRGLEQQRAALARAGFAPGLEGLGRGLHRHHGIGRRRRRCARGDRAVERIAALEGRVLFGRDLQAVDEHG